MDRVAVQLTIMDVNGEVHSSLVKEYTLESLDLEEGMTTEQIAFELANMGEVGTLVMNIDENTARGFPVERIHSYDITITEVCDNKQIFHRSASQTLCAGCKGNT